MQEIYIYWLSNYNNLRTIYKYDWLLILLHISLLTPSLVQAPFPTLSVIIFVSVLGFVMVLVTIISVTYKVISWRRNRRRTMDLPMQVFGLEDENTNPVLVVLGEWLLVCVRMMTDITNGWQKWIEPFAERRDVSKIISNQVIKMLSEADKITSR